MPLVDHQIEALCNKPKGLLVPFKKELLNPASIDVVIGTVAIIEQPCDRRVRYVPAFIRKVLARWFEVFRPRWKKVCLAGLTKEKPYWVQPKVFFLVGTHETFNLPDTIVGEFRLKSSRAREGYDNALAVYIDPGFNGSKLTLEIVNNCRYHKLPLYPGLRIGQIFFKVCLEPLNSYSKTGRYNLDRTVQMSRG